MSSCIRCRLARIRKLPVNLDSAMMPSRMTGRTTEGWPGSSTARREGVVWPSRIDSTPTCTPPALKFHGEPFFL